MEWDAIIYTKHSTNFMRDRSIEKVSDLWNHLFSLEKRWKQLKSTNKAPNSLKNEKCIYKLCKPLEAVYSKEPRFKSKLMESGCTRRPDPIEWMDSPITSLHEVLSEATYSSVEVDAEQSTYEATFRHI